MASRLYGIEIFTGDTIYEVKKSVNDWCLLKYKKSKEFRIENIIQTERQDIKKFWITIVYSEENGVDETTGNRIGFGQNNI